MNTVQAEYTYDRDECLRACRLANYTRLRKSVRILFFLFGLAVGFIGFFCFKNPSYFLVFSGLFLAFLVGLITWNESFQAKKDYEQSPYKNARLVFIFSEEKIEVSNLLGRSQLDWSSIIQAVQCKEGYFLFFERRAFRWLPRKAFASQEDFETFEKLVKEKVAVIKKV